MEPKFSGETTSEKGNKKIPTNKQETQNKKTKMKTNKKPKKIIRKSCKVAQKSV